MAWSETSYAIQVRRQVFQLSHLQSFLRTNASQEIGTKPAPYGNLTKEFQVHLFGSCNLANLWFNRESFDHSSI
jgi:hypothetical protein